LNSIACIHSKQHPISLSGSGEFVYFLRTKMQQIYCIILENKLQKKRKQGVLVKNYNW
jgi:hypothetical protein